ncbi:MAG TPA: molybdopterin cofactor-binding domain-containing protein, partial [Hyphomicrobiaceae bacterium]
MTAPQLPLSLARNPRLDRWVALPADGVIEVRSGKVEIGQGILTALAQIAAEELDVDVARIRMIAADTERSPNEGVTAGSRSTSESGSALRQACAEIRHAFLAAAAARFGVGIDELTVADGTVRRRSGNETATYWELSGSVDLARDARGDAAPKPASELTVVGKRVPRIDLPDKVRGGAVYVHDLELPGMLFGRVLRPPSYRAALESFDPTGVEAMPGVVAVVRDGRFIGVVAEREEQAVAAVTALAKCATWTEAADLPDVDAIPEYLRSLPAKPMVLVEKGAAEHSGKRVDATYSRPFIAHASLGPSCAVARWIEGRIEVWSQSQSIHPTRKDIALTLGLPVEAITIRHVEGPGCYGHNSADDAALDAVLLARAVSGRPVKLQLAHEDELAWEPFGPAMTIAMQGAVDADGRIVDWRHELWSNPHIARPGLQESPSLLAAWHIDPAFPQPPGIDALPGGKAASQRNALPIYDFANQRVVHHVLDRLPIRTGTLRAIGAFLNTFAIECFMDELAHSAGLDPVELRMRHLTDERGKAVIRAAAERAGLTASGGKSSPRRGSRGMGLAFARYSNEAAYAAVVAEVEVAEQIKVVRVVAAVDGGRAVNPDGIANQVEGGVVQGVSFALKEQVRFDRSRILTRTWEDYPILRFSEAPPVETIIIDRPAEPSLGMGEAVLGPAAAAIANAVYDAIGVRVRDLPMTRDRVMAAIEAG